MEKDEIGRMQSPSTVQNQSTVTSNSKIGSMRIYIPKEDKAWILERFTEILDSRILTNGKYCSDLESELSRYLGVKHVISTNSGTGALEAMIRAHDLRGEIVVTPETFSATIFAIERAGCRPVFADVGADMSLDPDKAAKKLSKKSAAIMTVHIGGHVSPGVWKLKETADRLDIPLLEDSAHAIGSKLSGKFAGTIGSSSGFSFFPTKVVGSAEGGFVATNDSEVAEKLVLLRDQGKKVGNLCVVKGYNWRMSEFQAVIALAQLRRLEEFIERRNQIAQQYSELLHSEKLKTKLRELSLPAGSRPNWYKFIAFLRGIDRTQLRTRLKANSIELSGEVYEVPCHTQPAFEDLGYKEGDFPVAEDICKNHVCFPLMANLTDEQVQYFCRTLPSCIA